jgi:alkylation response protein AidB-like acyl-CoA dehydrogenase
MFDHDDAPEPLPDYVRKAPRFCEDPVKVARELRPVIEAGAIEGMRTAKLADEVVRALAGSGLFGLRIPKEFGGIEASPRTYIDVMSELSYADGSTGWALMACGFHGGVGMGPSATERFHKGDEGVMVAAQVSKLGKAVALPGGGGYRVSGLFQFGSGSQFSSFFAGAFQIYEDGQPQFLENGRAKTVMCMAPREKIRLRGNWDVMGLQATGSYDYEFPEQDIHEDFISGLPGRKSPAAPINAIGVSIGHVAWALGVGDRILDEIKRLALSKRRFQRSTLVDQPVFQMEYGRHRSAMNAARALVYQVYDEWLEAVQEKRATMETRARARLTACWATEVALKAAQFAMFSAGSDGVRNRGDDNVIQRAFRDLQTGATHRHIDGNMLIDCTMVELGIGHDDLDI